VTIV